MRKRRQTLVDRLFSEYIAPGNLLYTRGSYYKELIAAGLPNHSYGADWLAFHPKALTPEEVQNMRDYWATADPHYWNRTGEVADLKPIW